MEQHELQGRRILLIITGGIAAYKSLELIRRLRDQGALITPVLTKGGAEFVTPLSVSALAGGKVYQDLFDLTDEAEMGHIQLSRSADLILVAPATADIMAKMAQGRANDLVSTLLLATDTPVMIAPAMNVRMWDHPATQRNLETLIHDGVQVIGPDNGAMACGEFGMGRLVEVDQIITAVAAHFAKGPLSGKQVLITSGPTHEPIDPVRYIANRSSGAQGAALAAALRDLGAQVRFITGPADVLPPVGVDVIPVQTADQMMQAVMQALPADVAIFAAAVADWRVDNANGQKIKKDPKTGTPDLKLVENADILAHVAGLPADQRPPLVIGFAAETQDVQGNAMAKRARKGCDWIIANDVSPGTGIMGGAHNQVSVIDANGQEDWPQMNKYAVAQKIAHRIAQELAK